MLIEITVHKTKDEDKDKPKLLQARLHTRITIQGDKSLVEEVHSLIEDCKMPDWEIG